MMWRYCWFSRLFYSYSTWNLRSDRFIIIIDAPAPHLSKWVGGLVFRRSRLKANCITKHQSPSIHHFDHKSERYNNNDDDDDDDYRPAGPLVAARPLREDQTTFTITIIVIVCVPPFSVR